jgi:TonB family protein
MPFKLLLGKRKDAMRRRVLFTTVGLIALTTSIAWAQNVSAAATSERKVASRVAANYPELAKKMHIHGVVRVEAVVKANGSVKTTRVLGGNPVLVDAAVEAVTKWKFEPGQGETTEVVQLSFEGQ